MDSFQHVMSQIGSVCRQESEKLRDDSNFTIWPSVLHFMAGQYGGVVHGYLISGALLWFEIQAERVRDNLDTIRHTLVTGRVFPEVWEEVLYNHWYGREVIVQPDKVYGGIGIEAAIIMVRALTSGEWRSKKIQRGIKSNSLMFVMYFPQRIYSWSTCCSIFCHFNPG